MRHIVLMIRREMMVLGHQWLSLASFLVVFPVIMFLCISMPLYKIISIPVLNYLHWSVPGILILTSSIICSNYGLRNIFLLRDKGKHYQMLLKSPMSIGQILLGMYMISVLYGIFQFIAGAVVLSLINPGAFSFFQCISIFLQVFPFLLFIASLSLFIGFLISNEEMVSYILITLFLIIAFAFGALLPIELFPSDLSAYLKNIPMVGIIMNTQKILHMETPFYFGVFLNIAIAVVVYLIAMVCAYKTLRRLS